MPRGKYIRTEEMRNKYRQARLGKSFPAISKAKIGKPSGMLGKHHSQETKMKMSERAKRRIVPYSHILQMCEARKGLKPWNWIEDRSLLKRYGDDNKDRRSYAYTNWRTQVWLRDKFKCRIANRDCDGRIEAHHILSYKGHPELRYEINNGITLCHAHHPRRRAEEKRLIPIFKELVSVSNEQI